MKNFPYQRRGHHSATSLTQSPGETRGRRTVNVLPIRPRHLVLIPGREAVAQGEVTLPYLTFARRALAAFLASARRCSSDMPSHRAAAASSLRR
jgi:hypothetical protein